MFNPNYLSRSQRRYGAGANALSSIQVSQPAQIPEVNLVSRHSVSDMMMFAMDQSVSHAVVDGGTARPRLVGPANHPDQRATHQSNYLGCLKAPTFFPREKGVAPKPQKRIVGFDLAGYMGSPSEVSSSDSESTLSDSGE